MGRGAYRDPAHRRRFARAARLRRNAAAADGKGQDGVAGRERTFTVAGHHYAVVVLTGLIRGRDKNVPRVTTAKVEKIDLVSKVTANGKIQARRKVDLSALVMGQIVNLAAKEGDRVQKGQLLLQIDRAQLAAQTAGRESALRSLQAAGFAVNIIKDVTPEVLGEPEAPPRNPRALRIWSGAGAAFLIASGTIHLDLYLTGYNSIPTIGPLFLLQIISAFLLAAAIPLTTSAVVALFGTALRRASTFRQSWSVCQ